MMIWYGLEKYAIFTGVIMIVLLDIKPRLREIEEHISPTDIHAAVLLLGMSFVVLPILPDKMIGPYHLVNPYKTWLMAVIISGISFVGYVAIKTLGQKHGVFLTGAAGGLTDPTQIMVRDLTRTFNDPLAAKVRAQLRAQHGFTRNLKRYFGIECVFSAQQQVYPDGEGEVGHRKPGIHGVHLDCSMGYGSASFVTASMGFVAVARLIEKHLRKCARATAGGSS